MKIEIKTTGYSETAFDIWKSKFKVNENNENNENNSEKANDENK